MRKINNWLDKPWTNGTYVKWTFWSFVWVFVIYFIMWLRHVSRRSKNKSEEAMANAESRFDEVQNKDFRL